jgi:SAM-dependent methyltransferase
MAQFMYEKVLEEFTDLTNSMAYVKIFSRRMMKPVPNKSGEFFGTDQRIDMLPFLQKNVASVPERGEIFDVGAGAGDVVDYALKNAPKGTVINIEDPNPAMIKSYLKRLNKYAYLKVGSVYEGPIQDYYQGMRIGIFPKQPQNLVLAIHMIYHLTDFTDPKIYPETDLIEAISFLYGLLAPHGSIFIVYADLLDSPKGEAVCGMGEKFFRQKYPKESYADNLISIYQARNALLGPNGSITDYLEQRYPDTKPKLDSFWRQCYFFGESIEDVAVLALAAELCPSNNDPFDLSKLQFCLEYITNYPERFNLQKEVRNVPQKGLWRANEPQIIATITKETKI